VVEEGGAVCALTSVSIRFRVEILVCFGKAETETEELRIGARTFAGWRPGVEWICQNERTEIYFKLEKMSGEKVSPFSDSRKNMI
jgi:hypothetical protein